MVIGSPSSTATWSVSEVPSFVRDSTMSPVALSSPVSVVSPSQRRFSQSHAAFKPRPQTLIANALKSHIDEIDPELCEPGEENAFFVADLGEVFRQHRRWKMYLPRVEPFYAVKCNGDPKVLRLLAALNTGFDCASKAEIQQMLDLGVDPSRIIYANPCKTASYIRYAAKADVQKMTFDNQEELYKVKKYFPHAQLFLRISTDDSKSLCRFSMKYGALVEDAPALLAKARELGLNIVGVSFHVGSGAEDPTAFVRAVQDARTVFDQAEAFGYNMHTVDVGGGFADDTFESIASILGPAIDQYFPPNVRVIAEPGRYYVATAFTLAAHVIARRTLEGRDRVRDEGYMLYLNDGVYGNFSNIIFDHQDPMPKVLQRGKEFLYGTNQSQSLVQYSIWGQSCDGIDVICRSVYLPKVLDIGDWLYFTDMGAYTKCSATQFNGFTNDHHVVYVASEPGIAQLVGGL